MTSQKFEPLLYLCQVFQLDSFEKHCVVVLWEAELKEARAGKTIKELAEGFGELAKLRQYFLPESCLMQYFLLWKEEINERRLVLDERILVFLQGNIDGYAPYEFLWERIDPLEERKPLTGNGPVPLMEQFYEESYHKQPVYFHLYGNRGIGRKSCILEFCKRQERSLLILDKEILLEENQSLLGAALRECRIYGAFLLIQDLPIDWFMESLHRKKWFQWICEETGVLFTTGEEPLQTGEYLSCVSYLELEIPMPDFRESCQLWEQYFAQSGCENLNPKEWANKFLFTPQQMKESVKQAFRYAWAEKRTEITRMDLQRGCYHLLRGSMGKQAVRIPACYTWEELVLPSYQKQKLKNACQQAANRKHVYETWGFEKKIVYGRGISVVFAGPPGTGKTMAAQVMAGELCLDLYRVELPAIVSKYIGETEKNLEEIFEQAKKSQVILFFDEADVLFSKRTEVRDSNDKYSNMEAAFLLQKMEEYEGITILATNFLQNFDEAFKRRMKFVIDFPFPDEAHRLEIWKQVFPSEVFMEEELDYEFLASSFELSGSNIKNVALHAAFLAAAEERGISMKHLIAGVRNEYEKNGKMLTRAQLGQYYMLLEKE